MCSARLIRLFPARDSRCRNCWPDDASSGAVPFQDAKWSRLANRWMLPTSASSRAALEGPMPCSWSSVEPWAWTSVVISFLQALILRSMPSSSVISSAASLRRVLPTMSRGLIVASSARACAADRNCLGAARDQLE